MRKIIRSIETGRTTILGTDWPITAQVERLGPREWQFAWGICNGTVGGAEYFLSRREALATLENYAADPEN